MAILRSTEPEHRGCNDPAEAVAALFRRKGLQRRVTEALPHLILPEPYRRLQMLREQGQNGTVHIKTLKAGEELTLEYSGKSGRSGSRLVVARNLAGTNLNTWSVIIHEAYGRIIKAGPRGEKLLPGMVVWLGYSTGTKFWTRLTKGTSPAWSLAVTEDKRHPDAQTDRRTTLRQVYYGNSTALPLL